MKKLLTLLTIVIGSMLFTSCEATYSGDYYSYYPRPYYFNGYNGYYGYHGHYGPHFYRQNFYPHNHHAGSGFHRH